MESILLFKQSNFSKTIWWKLKINIQGFQNEYGYELVTEVFKDRLFRIIDSNFNKNFNNQSRLLVQFYEDGYICWVDINKLIVEKYDLDKRDIFICDQLLIQKKIPAILEWIQKQYEKPNNYLWGGTVGPNYDCSGLIQAAFFSHGISIPRDAYQMKNFCKHLFDFPCKIDSLKMGDLLFFGNNKRCNHVGIYFERGLYFHSSGTDNGRDGIGLDTLINSKSIDGISIYYQSKFISAGRIIRSYQWDKTIR